MIFAVLTAVLQYIQSKQIMPQPTDKRRLRDVMSEASQGKEVDQTEVSAIMSQRMIMFFPVLTFLVMIYLPGAISLYMTVSSIVAIIQQRYILNQDVEEMEALASKPEKKSKDGTKVRVYNEASVKDRVANAKEAEVVKPAPKQRGKKRSKRR
jgi:YidC/Oxa1 family membrane protein insertase